MIGVRAWAPIARRQGIGRRLLIADVDDTTTGTVAAALTADGYEVVGAHVAQGIGARSHNRCRSGFSCQMIHTAGPVAGAGRLTRRTILRVDLYHGTAVVLAEFGDVIAEHPERVS